MIILNLTGVNGTINRGTIALKIFGGQQKSNHAKKENQHGLKMNILEGKTAVTTAGSVDLAHGQEVTIIGMAPGGGLGVLSLSGHVHIVQYDCVRVLSQKKSSIPWQVFDVAKMPNKDFEMLVIVAEGEGFKIVCEQWRFKNLTIYYDKSDRVLFYCPLSDIKLP